VADPEKVIDLKAKVAADQKARREARGYEAAFSEQAKRSKQKREANAKLRKAEEDWRRGH
jgi:hypothetical protein